MNNFQIDFIVDFIRLNFFVVVDFTFSEQVKLMETIRWKWHALHSIHMHSVWSQTDDWLPNFKKHFTKREDTVERHGKPMQYRLRTLCAHKCRLYLVFTYSSKLLLANGVRHPKCVLSAANGWSGARNEMAFIVYAHSNFLLNECMSLWQTLRILYSEEPNQRLFQIMATAVCVCYALRCTHTHIHTLISAWYHSLSALTLQTVRLPHSMQSCMHACEQMNSNEHFILISELTYPSFDMKSGQSAVLNDGTSDRENSLGRHAHCAYTNVDGEVVPDEWFLNKLNWWTGWEAVAGVSTRKVSTQERFHSFS